MPISGDLACADGRVPHGVDLITYGDRADTPAGTGQMLTSCLQELALEPQSLDLPFDDENAIAHYENLFAAGECFTPAAFYGAIIALNEGVTASNATADPRIARMYMRLLQQWVQLHSFVAKQGAQEISMTDVLRSRVDLGIDELNAVEDAPTFEALIDRVEKGWDLTLTNKFISKLFPSQLPDSFVREPDDPALAPERLAHHEQGVGLPATMLEGATRHLDLAAAFVRDAHRSSYGSCRAGGASTPRERALQASSRALRYALVVETVAASIRDSATRVTCTTAAECSAGYTCDGVCIADDGTWERRANTWDERWISALAEFATARARLISSTGELRDCASPAGFAEGSVPIYFGDPTGDSARFFASSDYLLNGWAKPAAAAALVALNAARSAWMERRTSEVQQLLSTDDADRRLESLSAQYGRVLVDACGLAEVEAKDALALFDGPGALSPGTCFVNWQDPTCDADAQPSVLVDDLIARMTDDIARYQLCLWDHVRASGGVEMIECVEGIDDPRTCAEVQRHVALVARVVEFLDRLGTSTDLANRASVVVDHATSTFNWSTLSLPLELLYEVRDGVNAISSGHVNLSNARSACMEEFEGVEHPLPAADDILPLSTEGRGHCYRGQLGEAALFILSANVDVQQALASWKNAKQRYSIDIEQCEQRGESYSRIADLKASNESFLVGMGAALTLADNFGSFTGGLSQLLTAKNDPDSNIGDSTFENALLFGGTAGGIAAGALSIYMGVKQRDLEQEIAQIENEQSLRDCYAAAKKERLAINSSAIAIESAAVGVDIQTVRFANLLREVERTLVEGPAAVSREQGRAVPNLAHHYWLDERIDRFHKDFEWARQLAFLAMRAVEYEFQQSLGLREQIVGADHPDDLLDAIRTLEQEQLTRTVNSRRPEDSLLVLSLRDQILRIADQSTAETAPPPGERDWSAVRTFQHRLWEPAYAVYNDAGKYLGQGISFTLEQIGALKSRCAERLWRLSATIQGDLLDVDAPAAPMFVIRRNSFASQWCEGRGDQSTSQVASLQPSSTLFHPEERGGSEAQRLTHLTAMLMPWFNVPRSEFYREAYAEGASEELAGRGLYGEYILLFPWDGLLEDGFPLEQVEDVLLRFDYLSVDNISGL